MGVYLRAKIESFNLKIRLWNLELVI
jgi:hypothetical protein